MFTIVTVCLAPTLMFAASRLVSRRGTGRVSLAVFEWLFDALLLASLTLLLFFPLGRVSTAPWTGHPLAFEYGKVAAAFSLLLGVFLGIAQGALGCRWVASGAPEERRHFPALRLPLHLLGLLLTFLTFAYLWGIRTYPVISLEEIVFHLHVPLEGTSEFFISDAIRSVALPTVAVFALYECLAWVAPHVCKRGLRLTLERVKGVYIQLLPAHVPVLLAAVILGAWSMLLLSCAEPYLDLSPFVYGLFHRSTLIEEEYVDPAKTAIVFPQEKRNLITIYLESCETTFQDVSSGGIASVNYTPELTKIASESLTFSQSELIQGAAVSPATGWTIAGLVAQTAGLPLKLFQYGNGVDNMGDQFVDFLPGATSLGELLEREGYRRVFMAGSDFTFGGRRTYFSQHGDYEVFDLLTAYERGLLPQDYYEGWGFEDKKLYAYAKEELTLLAASAEPFHFAMLTVDTHRPGFVYDCCPEGIADDYLRTVSCASRQVSEFLDWLEQQPFFENTTIVITGDHASMAEVETIRSVDVEEYDKYNGSSDRLVYNAFINAVAEPAQATNRRFTTMDFFPTVLASIGVSIEGERLGLGTNLFSSRPTLAEEYGYDALFAELNLGSDFYNEHLLYPKR